jgi:hypothetical protein
MRLCDAALIGTTLTVTNNQIQGLRIKVMNFVASHATKIALFALAQNRLSQHISTCLSGILSQDFQARLVRQPGFFLAHRGPTHRPRSLHRQGPVPKWDGDKFR